MLILTRCYASTESTTARQTVMQNLSNTHTVSGLLYTRARKANHRGSHPSHPTEPLQAILGLLEGDQEMVLQGFVVGWHAARKDARGAVCPGDDREVCGVVAGLGRAVRPQDVRGYRHGRSVEVRAGVQKGPELDTSAITLACTLEGRMKGMAAQVWRGPAELEFCRLALYLSALLCTSPCTQ